MENVKENHAYDWDGTIEVKGRTEVLPEGTYKFIVRDVINHQYTGGEKLPPCRFAEILMDVLYDDEEVTISQRFYLVNSFARKITSFYTSIGEGPVNGKLKMHWDDLNGKVGLAKFSPTTGKDGNTQFNNVSEWIPYDSSEIEKYGKFQDEKNEDDELPF